MGPSRTVRRLIPELQEDLFGFLLEGEFLPGVVFAKVVVIPCGDCGHCSSQGHKFFASSQFGIFLCQQLHIPSVTVNVVAQIDKQFWFPFQDCPQNWLGIILIGT